MKVHTFILYEGMFRCIRNFSTPTQSFLQKRFITSVEAYEISKKNKNFELTDKTDLIRKQINTKISYTSSRGLYRNKIFINEYRLSYDDILELKRDLEKDGFTVTHCDGESLLSVDWSSPEKLANDLRMGFAFMLILSVSGATFLYNKDVTIISL